METLELLLARVPTKRSILAAFGFDEEASGYHGAAHIGKYLEETFGQDSVYALIDEGAGLTVQELTNTIVALPGTAEKGYVDIQVELTTQVVILLSHLIILLLVLFLNWDTLLKRTHTVHFCHQKTLF